MYIRKAGYEFIDAPSYKDAIEKIEHIGRVCYKSENLISEGTAETFVRNLIKRGHESVIEHVEVSVRFICDRGVSHEIVRHRIASYAQESTRYCNYTKDKYSNQITYIDISTAFNYDANSNVDMNKYKIWENAMKEAEKSYFKLIQLGASPQEARSVLPNSLKTEIVATLNFRGWRNFFKLRAAKGAHPQMRELACSLLCDFIEKYPVLFEDLKDLTKF